MGRCCGLPLDGVGVCMMISQVLLGGGGVRVNSTEVGKCLCVASSLQHACCTYGEDTRDNTICSQDIYVAASYVATYSISAQFSALLDILGLFLYVVILSICEGRDARSVSTCKRLVLCARLCLVFAKILCEVPSSFVCYASFQLW